MKKQKEIKKAKPFIKWVGGTRQLMETILSLVPKDINTYYEPFLGGGAVLYSIEAKNKKASDVNSELINTYNTIKNKLEELKKELKKHVNEEEYFYMVRAWDRDENYLTKYTDVERASRFIFLNKTAFNGMWRENKKGHFNVPFGRMKNPKILDTENLPLCNKFFQDIDFSTKSFNDILSEIKEGDFIYLDPPYVPLSVTSSFTSYNKENFSLKMQQELKNFCDELNKKKVKFLLSNSSADFVLDLYKDYDITLVDAKRTINSKGDGRGSVKEVLVKNY